MTYFATTTDPASFAADTPQIRRPVEGDGIDAAARAFAATCDLPDGAPFWILYVQDGEVVASWPFVVERWATARPVDDPVLPPRAAEIRDCLEAGERLVGHINAYLQARCRLDWLWHDPKVERIDSIDRWGVRLSWTTRMGDEGDDVYDHYVPFAALVDPDAAIRAEMKAREAAEAGHTGSMRKFLVTTNATVTLRPLPEDPEDIQTTLFGARVATTAEAAAHWAREDHLAPGTDVWIAAEPHVPGEVPRWERFRVYPTSVYRADPVREDCP